MPPIRLPCTRPSRVRRPRTLAALCLALSAPAYAADWSDTFIGYRFGNAYQEPGNNRDIRKQILTLNHSSAYRLGSNFFVLDYLRSNGADPSSSGADNGATEFYLAYRHQLQWKKLSGSTADFGPIRDFSLQAGFDVETKNSAFSPAKRMLVIGPTAQFDVPGYLNLALLYAREWGECGLAPCRQAGNSNSVAFDPFPRLELAWGLPFQWAGLPLKFQGYAFYNAKKGKDYQNRDTAAEYLIRPSLMADIGLLAFKAKNALWLGLGYELRRNTYGNSGGPGIDTNTPSLNLEWHF